MAVKRRPLWVWIGTVYVAGVFAVAAGIKFGTLLYGQEC